MVPEKGLYNGCGVVVITLKMRYDLVLKVPFSLNQPSEELFAGTVPFVVCKYSYCFEAKVHFALLLRWVDPGNLLNMIDSQPHCVD